MSHDRLVTMANQIARAFAHRPHPEAVAETASHIRRFWEPRMRAAILARIDNGSNPDLNPVARDAIELLRPPQAG